MTLRPLHQWLTDCHDVVCKRIAEGVRVMDMGNVGRIEGPIKMSQVFEEDGVHLTASSGRVFVNALLYNADTFFNTEIIQLDEDMEVNGTERNGGTESDKDKNTNRITLVEREIANLKENIIRRREEDCLVTARMREELDFFSNTRKENMIIVTGLTSTIPMPVTVEEKKKWLKNVVGEVLDQVVEGASGHILNVIQGWNGRTNFPLAEVRMDSGDLATKIRKQFAAKKKGGHDFGKIYMCNSVTLGTRVRIEILKAMAKNLAGDKETMYVSAFASRPMLHVRSSEADTRQMAFSFADALGRYGKRLRQSDLGDAYRRAGNAFKGQLQQNFVVLYDSQSGNVPFEQRPNGPSVWVASGRPQAKRKMTSAGRGRGATGNGKRGRPEKPKQN
jgi:hypothetical protein